MKIWILDDLHWGEIYNVLKDRFPKASYPIKKDVKDPLPFLKKMKDWDIVLLDNYFDWWEWPLWDSFLNEYLDSWLQCKIIAISDFWEKLTEMFSNWKEANDKWCIFWWIKSKKWEDIADFIEKFQKNLLE